MRYACTIERHNGFPDIHVAVLLDHFLVGQGATKDAAIDDLELTIAATIHASVLEGEPDWRKHLGPAPKNMQCLATEHARALDPSRWVLSPVKSDSSPEWACVHALG
jgi:hypothetical protein